MSSSAKIPPGSTSTPTVRFSRTLSLRESVTIGGSVMVGLGIIILLGQISLLAKSQTLYVYLIAGIFSIPILLTYAERGAVLAGPGGPFNLARNSQIVWISYFTGWLLIGGFACLIALLGWGLAEHINIIINSLFGQKVNNTWLAIAVVGLVTLNNLISTRNLWRTRLIIFLLSIGILFYIIFRGLIIETTANSPSALIFPKVNAFTLSGLLMCCLWGASFIIDSRDQIHRPSTTILRAMGISIGLMTLLGVSGALMLNRFSNIVSSTPIPLYSITQTFNLISRDLSSVLYLVAGLSIVFMALNQTIVHSLRLIGTMSDNGFIPQKWETYTAHFNAPIIILVPLSLFAIILLKFVPIFTILGLTALTALWVAGLSHLPDLFSLKPKLPPQRRFKLPFHPLFPGLTVAIGFFYSLILPATIWIYVAIWLLAGGLYYLMYARRGGLATRRKVIMVGDERDTIDYSKKYQVLVGVANPQNAPALISAGAQLARANGGSLHVLQVILLPEQVAPHLQHQVAQEEWSRLATLIAQLNITDITIRPLIRLAPTPVSGILEVISEESIDLLLLGWEDKAPGDDINLLPVLDPLISQATCNVAILRGSLPTDIHKIIIPSLGGGYTTLAVEISQALSQNNKTDISVATFYSPANTAGQRTAIANKVSATLADIPLNAKITRQSYDVNNVKEGILNQLDNTDLIVMGASKEGFVQHTYFGGLPVEIAHETKKPFVLVKQKEQRRHFWLYRLWRIITGPLPTISNTHKAEVYLNMRQSARPTVDFFILILLSAIIATVGLLQNSTAVIIGAMLVAPLMSPILAMSMGIVRGNLSLLRVATEATTQGIALAIVVGIMVSLISPINAPTNEILSRTHPNILDLMVALASGAAAGYAICRKQVAAALPGVAIAAALVPPLCVVGYGFGTADLGIASGALILFITNLIAIVFSAALVFVALGFHPERANRQENIMRGFKVAVVSLIFISIVLGITTIATVEQASRQVAVENILNTAVGDNAEVGDIRISRSGNIYYITASFIVYEGEEGTTELTPDELMKIEQALEEAVGGEVSLEATLISAVRTDPFADLSATPTPTATVEGSEVR